MRWTITVGAQILMVLVVLFVPPSTPLLIALNQLAAGILIIEVLIAVVLVLYSMAVANVR